MRAFFCPTGTRWLVLGLMALLRLQSVQAEDYSFATLAGAVSGAGFADGLGSAARFGNLRGITLDTAGNVYVADGGYDGQNQCIRKITTNGLVSTIYGQPGSGISFTYLGVLVFDVSGNLLVTDVPGTWKITPSGVSSLFVASTFAASGTVGMAVDSYSGLIYQSSPFQCVLKIYPNGTTNVFAGSASAGPGSVDGTGLAARFRDPHGLAVDSQGNVYVADDSNATIRKIRLDGLVTTLAGSAGATGAFDGSGAYARFNHPTGLTLDSSGTIYVTDHDNHAIRKISPLGVVTTLAGMLGTSGNADGSGSSARFNGPFEIASDTAGNLFVADAHNFKIRKVTPAGVVTTVAGSGSGYGSADGQGALAQFYRPTGVAVDAGFNVYVADTRNHTIRKVTPNGTVTTLAGQAGVAASLDGTGTRALFNYPTGIAVDSQTNLYVADELNSTLRKITPDGTVSTLAGLAGNWGYVDGVGSAARFAFPYAVSVDGAGNIYDGDSGGVRKVTAAGAVTTLASGVSAGSVAVDSSGNVIVVGYDNVIRKINPAGVLTIIAGSPNAIGNADGIGTAARFNGPTGVAVDGAGNIFVSDGKNQTIRKITPDGTVSTIAGSVGVGSFSDGTGAQARFLGPSGLAVDRNGRVYVADKGNGLIRISTGTVPKPVAITSQPNNAAFNAGQNINLSVSVTGDGPLFYQWQLNGTNVAGANSATLTITNPSLINAGLYTVIISNAVNSVTSTAANLYYFGDPKLLASVVLGGQVGQQFRVDYADVVNVGTTNWQVLTNLALPYSPFLVIDPNSAGLTKRYYRAVPLP